MVKTKCCECDVSVYKRETDFAKAKLHFCTHRCRAIYYNHKRRTLFPRKCTRIDCNEMVVALDRNKKYCSQICANRDRHSRYTPSIILAAIQDFVVKNDRIPLKSEVNNLYRVARTHFGTWNNAIVKSGFDPNPVMFSKHYVAKDGHKCDSMVERIVDDWFSRRNIDHQTHVEYPWKNRMKCDFKVGNLWIEIFGLTGQNKKYDRLKKEKLRLIRQHGLSLITLTLKDVYSGNLDSKLTCLISRLHHPS